MTDRKTPLFHRAHYNIIAAQIRDVFIKEVMRDKDMKEGVVKSVARITTLAASAALTLTALNLAKRFLEDNPDFDPLKFLDACSPNVDLLPLSELWEG